MTKREELNALADRCEREEATHDLDWDIAVAARSSEVLYPLPYTSSLDAAVSLVPDAKATELSEVCRHVDWGEPHPITGSHEREYCVTVYLLDDAGYITGTGIHGAAETFPLALCAAALRARAALEASPPSPSKGRE